MAVTNAIIKAGEKALTKGSEKAIEKATTSAITKATEKAVNKALTKTATSGLTGLLGGKIATKSGSTLDGILGRSSGLILPEPKVEPTTLAKYGEELAGRPYNSIGDAMEDLDLKLSDIKADKGLSKKNYAIVENNAREAAKANAIDASNALGITSKSNLPMLNRQQFYDDTLGKVGSNGVSRADVPASMQSHLSDKAPRMNDSTLRELFGANDDTDLSELYDRYQSLAEGADAKRIFTPENIDTGVAMEGKKGEEIVQDFADRTFGNKRDIAVSGGSSPAKKVKVSRPTADMGVEEAVAETDNTGLANKIAEMKEQLQTATGGAGRGNGGGAPTATAFPDYGGLGDSGFANKLNEQANRPVNVQVRADGSAGTATKQQQGQRFIRDKAIKNLNTTPRQYADLMGKSRSIGNYYEKVADRIKAENIVQANVAQKTEAALNHIENIKARAFETADELGLTIDLSGIDNTIGLKPYQKKQLTDLGYNLNDIIGDKVLSATQAEEVYKILRGYAYDLLDDTAKPLEKAAGKELNRAADEVSKRIDDVLDNMGIDFKKEFLDGAGVGGVDMNGKYLREISQNGKPLSFSDLRREESDWINISKTAGRPIKEEKVPESIAEAVSQVFKKGGEKAREKYYERQAYGPGGGNMGGGSVPPTGGSATGGNVNFETIGGRTGTLGNLLSKAKNAGLVGAGVLGGMMLGGGGGGSSAGGSSDFANMYNANMGAETEPEIDPYQTLTIGGYTYDDLEAGYMAAIQAGDSDAAKLIQNMMGMLDDKVSRYYTAQKNSSSGSDSSSSSSSSGSIAGKQKAALNVLSSLMNNYQSQGPIGGRFTQFMNALTGGGYAPGIAAYDSGAQGSLGTIIKALGDTGALSEGDQKRALELLPKTTDSEEAAKMKYQQLIQILQGAGSQ